MNEITFYAFRERGANRKEQIFITIDCKNKTFATNKNQRKWRKSRYRFFVL